MVFTPKGEKMRRGLRLDWMRFYETRRTPSSHSLAAPGGRGLRLGRPGTKPMSIKELPADARPREKLLALGPAALADAELLALLLRTGLKGQGVLQLAESVLERFGGFAGLLHSAP